MKKELTKKQKVQIQKVIQMIKLYPAYNAAYLIEMFEKSLIKN